MIRTIAELRTRLADARAAAPEGTRVALVSTIGALHDGHIDLIRTARESAGIVVVSSFVNPLRFATHAEYEAYPRTPDADAALLERLGVDLVFAPDAAELLPAGKATTRVSAGDLGLRYEGRVRPFYFDGLLTVEAQLLNLVRPDVAVYGERDRQRVFLVRRMVRELFFNVEIVEAETVRSDDGRADLDAAGHARRGGSRRCSAPAPGARGRRIQRRPRRRRVHRGCAERADGRVPHPARVSERRGPGDVPSRRRGPSGARARPDRRLGRGSPLRRQRRDLRALSPSGGNRAPQAPRIDLTATSEEPPR
ncbi:hypothetical protein QE377_001830 [Microbacterium sp. SORGH_AS 862]|nr:hypothetical protein [Microbacterium sp. SORGH_AS_0862]